MILNMELFPQPFGPVIIKCIPGLIVTFIFSIKTSPFGERIGTSWNPIFSDSKIYPPLYM
jgi:hypothetical protein